MKRIALFISSLQKGGSERVIANLAVYFRERNYDVVLVTQYKREDEYRIPPEIRMIVGAARAAPLADFAS